MRTQEDGSLHFAPPWQRCMRSGSLFMRQGLEMPQSLETDGRGGGRMVFIVVGKPKCVLQQQQAHHIGLPLDGVLRTMLFNHGALQGTV